VRKIWVDFIQSSGAMGVAYSVVTFALLKQNIEAIFFATLTLRTLIGVRYVTGKHPGLSTWPPELENAYVLSHTPNLKHLLSLKVLVLLRCAFGHLANLE